MSNAIVTPNTATISSDVQSLLSLGKGSSAVFMGGFVTSTLSEWLIVTLNFIMLYTLGLFSIFTKSPKTRG